MLEAAEHDVEGFALEFRHSDIGAHRGRGIRRTYPDIIEVNVHKPIGGFDEILLECLAVVVDAFVGTETLDPAAFLVGTCDADDFGSADDLVSNTKFLVANTKKGCINPSH